MASLHPDELRELLPAALILESLAIRRAPAFDAPTIERLRGASARLRRVATDPAAAARAEHEFHRELLMRCGDARLLAVALPVERALLPYRRAAPVGEVPHDAVVDALERGDHATAAQRIRASFAATLARLLAGVERPQAVA